jgi:hypothetical protein
MADLSGPRGSDPIPERLSEAFHHAVWLFDDWTPSVPELEVSLDRKPFSMSAVCGLVDTFNDPLPEQIVDRLLSYMHIQHAELRGKLAQDRSYAGGARCLLGLIDSRKAEYEMLTKVRREKGLD